MPQDNKKRASRSVSYLKSYWNGLLDVHGLHIRVLWAKPMIYQPKA